MNIEPISPLRRRILDAMAVRNFSNKTRHDYIRHVRGFAAFLGRSPIPALRGSKVRRRFTCLPFYRRHCHSGSQQGQASVAGSVS